MSAAYRRRPKGFQPSLVEATADKMADTVKWPRECGSHTILSRASGPDLLLLERACGEPAEERGNRPDLASGRHHGSRYAADPARMRRQKRGY